MTNDRQQVRVFVVEVVPSPSWASSQGCGIVAHQVGARGCNRSEVKMLVIIVSRCGQW